MSLRFVAAAVVLAAGAGIWQDACAGEASNGLSANGLSANGLSANGLVINGLSPNGLVINGLATNGITSDPGELIAVILPDGSRVIIE